MALNPQYIRKDKLADKGDFEGSGVSGNPTRATAEYGKQGLRMKIDGAVAKIKESVAR
jgi:creatinine amidohydrolase/Fe(II)-dependent formamide hydrolase-like protein